MTSDLTRIRRGVRSNSGNKRLSTKWSFLGSRSAGFMPQSLFIVKQDSVMTKFVSSYSQSWLYATLVPITRWMSPDGVPVTTARSRVASHLRGRQLALRPTEDSHFVRLQNCTVGFYWKTGNHETQFNESRKGCPWKTVGPMSHAHDSAYGRCFSMRALSDHTIEMQGFQSRLAFLLDLMNPLAT